MDDDLTTQALIDSFVGTLSRAPKTHADMMWGEPPSDHGKVDYLVNADIGGVTVTLVVTVKRSAFPRDVREAVWQLRNYLAHLPNDTGQMVPVVVAESISPGAKSLLRDENIGYYDLGGSLYIPAHGALLFIDKPLPKRQARSVNALFAGRRAQVLHAVWLTKENWFGVHEIAARAAVSPATASETLIALERREWVISKGSGPAKERRLSDPKALLDDWTQHQKSTKPKPVRYYYVRAPKIDEIVHRLDRVCMNHNVPYAVTGPAAAQTYAPYLSTISQVHCRLPAGSEDIVEALDARPVREGWNLGIIDSSSSSDFIFRERVNDAWFADPLQSYLDLLQLSGRSREMAEHLRAEQLSS